MSIENVQWMVMLHFQSRSWTSLFCQVFAIGAVASTIAVASACDPTQMPGTTLGTFAVTGTLTTNTCGASDGAPTPWTFNVELSQDGSTLYWNQLDGSAFISGTLATKSVTITSSVAGSPDATEGGVGACDMQRDQSIAMTLDSATAPASFTGTFTYAFSVLDSSNCADQLSASGGTYQSLPCTIEYTMTASKSSN